MKKLISFISIFLISLSVFSQNPYKYESKVITLNSVDGGQYVGIKTTVSSGGFIAQSRFPHPVTAFNMRGNVKTGSIDIHRALELVHKILNENGYSLKSTVGNVEISGIGSVTLFFEKSSSYREAELYKLINELTTRIDATSKKYTQSAMVEIQTNVLNYLKSIPNEVITQAYKDELTKIILSEAEDKLKEVVEELKAEIRNSSTGID